MLARSLVERLFTGRVPRRIQRVLGKTRTYPFLRNVNAAPDLPHSKRALLLFVPESFVLPEDAPQFRTHHNYRKCRHIAAVLGELGYVVDVGDGRDPALRPAARYDVVISQQARLGRVTAAFKPTTIKVFLATCMNHTVHNVLLRRRHERLQARRSLSVKQRRIHSEHMPYVASADAVVGGGNAFTLDTWKSITAAPIYSFNNFGYRDTVFDPDAKDFAAARTNFLFFASRSQVMKGLDLLLEIFPNHPELCLYVCSDFEKERDFCDCYRVELFETPNVHAIGRIQINSARFNELVRTCAYVVAPSSGEGQSGAVVQCMHAGLIPLVTRAVGIDTEGFGITFKDDSVEGIERVILDVAQRPPEWHRQQAFLAREAALTDFSEDAFLARLKGALTQVLSAHGAG
jgi:glycosyltransferase involved in cell wall biosynthesis